ncbi:MAG: YitT family protein, partial [Paenibacillaceae bacterium]|nr:YitT family protein [Paenibacillaceae bacterium]
MMATALIRARESLPIVIGTAIYAFGLHYFVIPNQLMEGGLMGIALLLNYSLDLPPSVTTLVMNVPLYWIAWRMLDRQSMVYTAVGTLSLSFFLWVMEMAIDMHWIKPLEMDRDFLLAALCAGVTLGAGLGLVFRSGGTTGGSDIIARLGYKLKGWSMGRFVFAFDAVVIASSLLYIPPVKVLYTLVAVYITSR